VPDAASLPEGVRMSLLIGPAVPVPVPREVLDALVSVRVQTPTRGPSTFQLAFGLDKRSPLHTLFLLSGGAGIPLVRVIVAVTLGGATEVLIDGVMTNHEVAPGSGGGAATLTVTGEDLSRVMDYLELDGIPYPAMPPSARVLLALAKYAALGVVPLVIPEISPDVPVPTERIPRHQGTDLDYVQQLAREVGYVFYLEPGPAVGTSVAYWGPAVKVGVPQPALNTDMDAHTNVESLSFSFDSESRALPIVFLHNQQTKAPIPIPIPDVSPLAPPLGVVPPLPKKLEHLRAVAKLSPMAALARGLARAADSSEAVTGRGDLDVLRYGRVLKARRLVGVRGAGPAFDGLHYVDSVSHEIERGRYRQSFTLSRNGLLSTVSEVAA